MKPRLQEGTSSEIFKPMYDDKQNKTKEDIIKMYEWAGVRESSENKKKSKLSLEEGI